VLRLAKPLSENTKWNRSAKVKVT